VNPDERCSRSLCNINNCVDLICNVQILTESIPDLSKYPHAPAMMQPVSKPIMTEVLFMIGEPNLSQSNIVKKTEKPRPTVV
jgi:hypothetical protein